MRHQLPGFEVNLSCAINFLDDRFVAENIFRHIRRHALNTLKLGIDGHRTRTDQVRFARAGRPTKHDMGLPK